jgi:hypothetical protein
MRFANRVSPVNLAPLLVDCQKPPIPGDIHHVTQDPCIRLAIVVLATPTSLYLDDHLRRTSDSATQLILDGRPVTRIVPAALAPASLSLPPWLGAIYQPLNSGSTPEDVRTKIFMFRHR